VRIIKLDRAIDAALRHCAHDDGAEPAPLRRRHWRPLALGPAHSKGIADGPPGDIDVTVIRRECPVFSGIGGELVECEPDCLCGSRREAQLRATYADTRTNQVSEVRELGTN
jgi:hypothetical protein